MEVEPLEFDAIELDTVKIVTTTEDSFPKTRKVASRSKTSFPQPPRHSNARFMDEYILQEAFVHLVTELVDFQLERLTAIYQSHNHKVEVVELQSIRLKWQQDILAKDVLPLFQPIATGAFDLGRGDSERDEDIDAVCMLRYHLKKLRGPQSCQITPTPCQTTHDISAHYTIVASAGEIIQRLTQTYPPDMESQIRDQAYRDTRFLARDPAQICLLNELIGFSNSHRFRLSVDISMPYFDTEGLCDTVCELRRKKLEEALKEVQQ